MPACDSGERREHADRVERDQLGHVGLEQHDQHGGRDGQADDPVREDQAMAADRELARHEVVGGVEVRESREVGERGVRREDQDQAWWRPGARGTTRSRARPGRRSPDPTWEMTVFVSVGRTCSLTVRNESPRNISPRRLPIHISVVRAFFHSTGLNAGTPFETASTPVTAAPPDANAFRMRNSVTAPVACATSGGDGQRVETARELPEEPDPEHQEHHEDEEVGGHGEHPARLRAPRGGCPTR